MPPKAKIPAPIDRPLSRAYLREFTGWSTAYPPGLSDPTSLRLMENVQINRDGSARVRPGMRYLSYAGLPVYDGDELTATGSPPDETFVGTHETFFLNDGSKAYLCAMRELTGEVGFRVLANTGLGQVMLELDSTGIDFTFEPDYASICFTAATQYVKFLQVDNKIFALSDAGETMREFFVGSTKRAKLLQSIDRPAWTVEDKLEVVHPDAAWITAATPTGSRTNLATYPSFEANVDYSPYVLQGEGVRSADFAQDGGFSLKLTSAPERTNFATRPLGDVNTHGTSGWTPGVNAEPLTIDAGNNALRITSDDGAIGQEFRGVSAKFDLLPSGVGYDHEAYKMAITLEDSDNLDEFGIRLKFYNSSGVQIGADRVFTAAGVGAGRKIFSPVDAPVGTREARAYVYGKRAASGATVVRMSVSNFTVVDYYDTTVSLDGDDGVNFFWTGAANNSTSVYHPPKDVEYAEVIPLSIGDHTVSAYVRSSAAARNVSIGKSGSMSVAAPDAAGAFTRFDHTFAQAVADSGAFIRVLVEDVPRGEYHYLDSILIEEGLVLGAYFDGSTTPIIGTLYAWNGVAHESSSKETTYAGATTPPTAETPTADTLIATSGNDYSFGFFYTFSNEVGESAVSQSTIVKTKRGWSQWLWESPDGAGEPSGTAVVDPALAADQLVAIVPEAVFDDALSAGALRWSLYVFTWSNTDSVPVDAVLVGTRELNPDSVYDEVGWFQVTLAQSDVGTQLAALPSLASRYNYSDPSRAGQGIVAADRMVLVKDPTAAAVIRWSSNQQGEYTNFSARLGGGYKTLTQGNLLIPSCVKLWQNPQSVDTLTILCVGVDGHSSGYYMAPASVQSQADAVPIMGFEETTATPGTVSPYGVEVLNNALFHPLDTELMKSTAANYNINHKTQTEQIENMWRGLLTKHRIVSSQHDNRLYYIVNNPAGELLEEGCWGNEIWVFDAGKDSGTWSRWLIQAQSLRKIEQNGSIHMSVVRPDGIYYLDDSYSSDDYVSEINDVQSRPIPWLLETNTQGANRAHDALCNLQQANIVVGNFQGTMRYGVKGWDRHGKPFDMSKIVVDELAPGDLPYDLQDFLLVRKDAAEWFFYAQSVEVEGEVLPSAGQLSLVQYRYSPLSVNAGFEHGSVETYEYGRVVAGSATQNTVNGTPVPMIDVRRP
jgi:hypothetical protein